MNIALSKNPYANIVITAVTLETLNRAVEIFTKADIPCEISQIAVTVNTKSRQQHYAERRKSHIYHKRSEADMKRIMISGTNSGCGKTTVVCALLKALSERSVDVGAFKCGPDYIDPMFHSNIIGTKSYNLDSYFCPAGTLSYLLKKNSADMNIIEGAMGYYDGIGESHSACRTAVETGTPAVIVIDCN